MNKLFIIVLLLLSLNCSSKFTNEECRACSKDESGISKLTEMERTVVFDTITVVIEGKVVDINTMNPIRDVSISINDNETKTDRDGLFLYSHIPGGKNKLTVQSRCYQELTIDTLNLGIGCGWQMKIELGCIQNE
jgi:hypothetical protein